MLTKISSGACSSTLYQITFWSPVASLPAICGPYYVGLTPAPSGTRSTAQVAEGGKYIHGRAKDVSQSTGMYDGSS